ncbi:MAG: sulfatase-like hydrolase/transferase, partial [Deltaproteobacteria bacterium]|nr:sulfatase-like hydrolase/transferase [Deltaproteobacteria bacterium]
MDDRLRTGNRERAAAGRRAPGRPLRRAERPRARIDALRILALGLTAALLACAPAAEYPSVILVTVDTLRADHLTSYGYERPTSPGIARFAQEAMLFERCYSHAPSTRISFSSLLTGYLPH